MSGVGDLGGEGVDEIERQIEALLVEGLSRSFDAATGSPPRARRRVQVAAFPHSFLVARRGAIREPLPRFNPLLRAEHRARAVPDHEAEIDRGTGPNQGAAADGLQGDG